MMEPTMMPLELTAWAPAALVAVGDVERCVRKEHPGSTPPSGSPRFDGWVQAQDQTQATLSHELRSPLTRTTAGVAAAPAVPSRRSVPAHSAR
jgi:hypothetical protein